MKKGLFFLVLLFILLSANKLSANTVNQRAGVKKFLAKFNVLRTFTSQFVERLRNEGFEVSEVYDAFKTYQGQPLDKVTFYVKDSQLKNFDVLKNLNEIEFIYLLVVE